jgi:ubiquinone/menaquinone biosynthesis C-methylase UbiE
MKWFHSFAGQKVLNEEKRQLDSLLANLFGYYLAQIGSTGEIDISSGSRISQRFVLSCSEPKYVSQSHVICQPESLPLASDHIDLMVLPHVLEYAADPHEVLREVDRILIPEGHVVILGFNPFSMAGLRKIVEFRDQQFPWNGHFFSMSRITDWLTLLGFDIIQHHTFYHEWLPIKKLTFVRSFNKFGNLYVILAKKRISTLTPFKPRWHLNNFAQPSFVKSSSRKIIREKK